MNKAIKRISLVALLAAFVLTSSAATAATTFKIAYVDLQEALLSIKEGKKVKKKLEGIAKKKKKELEKEQEAIKDLKTELEKQAALMKEEERRKKLVEFQTRVEEFQAAYLESQQDLAKKEQEMTRPIFNKMLSIVEEMAQEMGYDMIMEKGAVLYATSNSNLTDELIKRYNAKHKGK